MAKSILLFIFLIFCAGCSHKDNKSTSTKKEEAKDSSQFEKANNLFQSKSYEKSKSILEQIPSTDSDFNKAKFLLEKIDSIETLKSENKKLEQALTIESSKITYNIIDNPELSVVIRNNSNKVIDGYTIASECFDNFNEPVRGYKGNTHSGIDQTKIKPKGTVRATWTLFGMENATKATSHIKKFHLADEDITIDISPENYIFVKTKK
ncbi:MAG: hypothetical protein JSS63_10645 [Bacteroidetes bacterium]|nr:hypothetical protein [Bacteroidota bacterium]